MARPGLCVALTIVFGLCCEVHAQNGADDALQQIEGVRGGRHWIDQPTAPPKGPEESLACLEIEPGFEIQLIAAEPLVKDPVAIAFDDRGQLFVAEYGDYPVGPPEGEDPLSKIVLLDDTDGDGVLDRRTVFADRLNFAHSFMPYRDGLLVGAHSEVLYLKDSDGDRVADVREVLFDGFKPAHPQMQIGCPRWGLDNWVSLTYGPGNVASSHKPDTRVSLPGKDFRFNPLTMQFEADTGLGQYGNTVDRWGHRFFCTNRNPIIATLLPPSAVSRNQFAVIPKVEYSVGRSGGETRVYPLIDMKSNYLSHAGTHTAACGVTAYTGDLGDSEFQDSVFVCEPIGHLVTRSVVEPFGVRLKARRAREKADFLASTDTWFRPVSLANGPDGALYLADMYRLWVEHPNFLPPEIAARIDWRAGEDRGRIYRIVPEGASGRSFQPARTLEDQVALMDDGNGWRQFLGQRLIVESQNSNAVPLVRRLLQSSSKPTARLHALWTLDGLKSLAAEDLAGAMGDSDPHIRADAARLSSSRLDNDQVFGAARMLANDVDARVRFELAVALGESHRPEAVALLTELGLRDGQDAWFARGLMTATAERAGSVLCGIVEAGEFISAGTSAKIDLCRQLSASVGSRGDVAELEQVLRAVTAEQPAGVWWRAAVINGLGRGLVRHRGDLGRKSLTQLLKDPPPQLQSMVTQLGELLDSYQNDIADDSQSVADRTAAVELLAHRPSEQTDAVLESLLAGDQPVGVQSAAIRVLSARGLPAARIIIDRWPQIGPSVRGLALATLLRRSDSIQLAFEAMASGQMNASALSVDQRVLMLKHKDESIRTMAEKLFGGAVSDNRREVTEQYKEALERPGSVAEGAKVFRRACAQCHRVAGAGHEVGPDITDVRNRSRSAILFDILDPNAKVEPQFTAYTVVTTDGRVFSGLMSSDSADAIVLKMAENRQETIARAEIEEIRASKVSLMPEGIEKDVTVQNMADLLEFLKSRPPQTVSR